MAHPANHVGRRALVAALVAAAALAGTACGKSETVTILNTEKVERAIEGSIMAQRGKTAHVSCPSGVHQKKGISFSCTAVVKRVATAFAVTQEDGDGQVRYVAR